MNDVIDEIDKLIEKRKKEKMDKLFEAKKIEEKKEEIPFYEPVIKEEPKKEPVVFDTIQEQIESPMTTIHCIEAIDEKELPLINKHPENYIEINFIKNIRIVDSFYIHSNIKTFHYDKYEYNIIEERIYILPTKKGFFIPTCFFKEKIESPVDFIQKNEGISGKALSLLYDVKLYVDLFSGEEGKYNIFIVLLLIASMSCYIVGLYFNLGGTI